MNLNKGIDGNYLGHWLNVFIKSGVITQEHLIYQKIDAFLVEQLSQPDAVKNWERWPTLLSYCESLFELASRKGYRFYLGSKRFGLQSQRDVIASSVAYCNPGPSISTLDSKKLPPLYNSGPHLNNIMLLLTLLDSLDGIPCWEAPGVKKYITVLHYDGMPLNIGTFPRVENNEVIFDGLLPQIDLNKMKELYQHGNTAVQSYITGNCKWVSEVKEYDMCDASGTVHVNVFTSFASSGGDAESIKADLRESLSCLNACSNCILKGNANNCFYPSSKEPCTQCTALDLHGGLQCVSAFCIHVSSDQASAQRRAHIELNKDATQDFNDSSYRFYGFGLLHFCKNCISSLRHYRLTDMSETFYVGLMSAVWASNTPEAQKMKEIAPAAVFSFRDAQSDELSFQTVSEPLEEILKETHAVVATLVPEQYKPTSIEAKTHSILGRPLYIATNSNGDILWTDAVFEYVGMGNRHIPTKCIALGKWDNPGPAHESPVIASKASFKHPAGIDVLIIEPGKHEVAFVCDKGNSCIRFIKCVHSFYGDKFVGTLKLNSTPNNWHPEGLTVVGNTRIAVTEGRSLYLVCMEDTLVAGQLVQVIDNLQTPHGLCLSNVPDNILVADQHTIKQIDLDSKTVTVVAQGFKMAFDVAISANGVMGVTDIQAHKISLLKKTGDATYICQDVIGNGIAGCLDGPVSSAQISEPAGLCFDFNTALFCCFGGKDNGYIKLHTTVKFACNFMSKIRQLYSAIGFLPKKEQNRLAQAGRRPVVPYVEGLYKLVDSLAFLENLIHQRKQLLNISPAGPEGTVYHISIQGFSETVKSLQAHLQAIELFGMKDLVPNLSLSAFTNEARKEHGFAKHKQSGQYRHPTKQQYCRTKGSHEIELIKKTCQCPHAYHTNTFSAYQPTHKSCLSSVETIAHYKKWSAELSSSITPNVSAETKNHLQIARMLNVLTKARPSQNIRDLYRHRCGYGPSVLFQKDAIFQDHTVAMEYHFPSFNDLMKSLEVQRGSTMVAERVRCNDYLFLPGDIVVVNPGTDNDIPSGDKWWLLQINKAHPANRIGSGCHVFGFWLDKQDPKSTPESENALEGQHFHLTPAPVKIYFGSIIKEKKVPVVIPVEKLSSGWKDGGVVYTFQDEYCAALDSISDASRKGLDDDEIGQVSESGNCDDDEEGTAELNVMEHEMELNRLHQTRQRVIRNHEGETVSSYRDLYQRRNIQRRKQHFPNQSQRDDLTEAERNCNEFDM